MRKTLFLNPPSFEGFDGGAGARYQARREVRSFWFPTWLAHPAALVEGSKLIDAPPADTTLEEVLPAAKEHELAILHTSTPSFRSDVKTCEALKDVPVPQGFSPLFIDLAENQFREDVSSTQIRAREGN